MSGKMWVFGGFKVKRQLSSGQCHLKTEGTLPFDLWEGAANTFDGFNGAETALLCFGGYPYTLCNSYVKLIIIVILLFFLIFLLFILHKKRFDGSRFVTEASSNHEHQDTSLGKITAGLVAISGRGTYYEVELYASGKWLSQPKFPEEKPFYYYSVATYEDLLYVFGEFSIKFDRHFVTIFHFYFRWFSS